MQLTDLSCIILPTRFCPNDAKHYYINAYQFWHRSWLETFINESKTPVPNVLFSDEFLLQDLVVGLFLKEEPLGLFLLKWVDLTNPAELNLSYFRSYPQNTIDFFHNKALPLLIISYFIVVPNWRNRFIKSELPLSEVLFACATRIFMRSNASAIAAITRDDRKTNEIFIRSGGKALHKTVLYGRDASIMAICREDFHESTIVGADEIANELWEKRLEWDLKKKISATCGGDKGDGVSKGEMRSVSPLIACANSICAE